jgi:hypothetical protein
MQLTLQTEDASALGGADREHGHGAHHPAPGPVLLENVRVNGFIFNDI